jgi:hypothetical protein
MKGLVFDFGGPVLLTPFEVRSVGERNLGLPAGSLAWTVPSIRNRIHCGVTSRPGS